MNTREELVEVMAKGFEPTAWNASLFEFPDLDMPPRQEAAKRRARAALAAIEGKGGVVVPREPTDEMIARRPMVDRQRYVVLYREAIAASPFREGSGASAPADRALASGAKKEG